MGGGWVFQALQLGQREQHSVAGPELPDQLKVQDAMHLTSAEQLIAKDRGSFLLPEAWREKQESSKHHKSKPNNAKSLFRNK